MRAPYGTSASLIDGTLQKPQVVPEPSRVLAHSDILWLLFAAMHMPLAIAMREMRYVATAHAVLTLGLALFLTLTKRRRDPFPMLAAAYIVGAEVLWRATKAGVFWEFGKYAVVLVLGLGILRRRILPKGALVPIAYFALLIPSCFFWLGEDFTIARQQISFNLSGPFCLAVCAVYFSGVQMNWPLLRKLFLSAIAPIVGMATVAAHAILTAKAIQFTAESNFIASGGFGPNQVSQTLGLGALLCWFLMLMETERTAVRRLSVVLFLWFTAHALLTFSRGGVYLIALGMLATMPHILRRPNLRKRAVLTLAVLTPVFLIYLLPRLDAFTGGKLSERFSETSGTNRELIAREQFEIFLRHPIAGVGPGKARSEMSIDAVAHTEFSRLLAEHGMFGLTALIVLLTTLLKRYRRAKIPDAKAVVGAATAWSLGSMAGYAMRLSATSFIAGLAFAEFAGREIDSVGRGVHLHTDADLQKVPYGITGV